MGMEKITNFGMKNSSTLPSLANNFFSSLRDENDEPVYTYTDPFMKNVLKQSIKGGRCNAFNQHYISEISDDVFIIISKDLDINGNICEILEKYFKVLNKYEKQYAEEFDSKYDEYRDIDQDERTDYNKRKLNTLPIHKEFSKLDSKKTQMDYDATSLYRSAMWDENLVYPKKRNWICFQTTYE